MFFSVLNGKDSFSIPIEEETYHLNMLQETQYPLPNFSFPFLLEQQNTLLLSELPSLQSFSENDCVA